MWDGIWYIGTLLLQMWKVESWVLIWSFCKKISFKENTLKKRKCCKYVTWSAYTPHTMFVESLCFALNLRRLLGKAGHWGIFAAEFLGRSWFFPVYGYLEKGMKTRQGEGKKEKKIFSNHNIVKIFWFKINWDFNSKSVVAVRIEKISSSVWTFWKQKFQERINSCGWY